MSECVLIVNAPFPLEALQRFLEAEGMTVLAADEDVTGILRILFESRPDVILMGLTAPLLNGRPLYYILPQITPIPIATIGTPSQHHQLVYTLEEGADDFIIWPTARQELVARVKALLRRTRYGIEDRGNPVITVGDVTLDTDGRRVTKQGRQISLTPTEFKLLAALMEERGRLVPHRTLLSRVWGPEFTEQPQHLRLYIGYLRQKLEENPDKPRYILNEWGQGYRFGGSNGDSG